MTKGFSLMELVVYSALVALIITFATVFAISIMKETARSSSKEEVLRNVASILQAFDFEVHHSSTIYTPTSDFLGNPGRLSLLTSRVPSNGESTAYLDMYVDSGAFCLKRELMGVSCVTSSTIEITSLAFRRMAQSGGQESVQMRLTLRYIHPNVEFQFPITVQTTARLRGY